MPEIHFSSAIRRHIDCPSLEIDADTVRAALERAFEEFAPLESYLLDDQGAVRHHVAIFVDGEQIRDRARQADAVGEGSRIDVMQALSGG